MTIKTRISVVHLVPAMNIGGVEVAIKRSYSKINDVIEYKIYCVKNRGVLDCEQGSLRQFLRAIFIKHDQPDCVITSLWWSHPFGLLAKMRGITWVSFYHNSGIKHLLETIWFSIAWKYSDARFADSYATIESMKRYDASKDGCLVSYVFEPDNIMVMNEWSKRQVDIIFIGRNARVKRLDLVIDVIEKFSSYKSNFSAKLIIAGKPTEELHSFVSKYPRQIELLNDVGNDVARYWLCNSKFFLMLSDYEGMSMATVEAIQAGCIAVVRPVGEVANYLDNETCITVTDINSNALRIIAQKMENLMRSPEDVAAMNIKAKLSLGRLPTYVNSFINAVDLVVNKK